MFSAPCNNWNKITISVINFKLYFNTFYLAKTINPQIYCFVIGVLNEGPTIQAVI